MRKRQMNPKMFDPMLVREYGIVDGIPKEIPPWSMSQKVDVRPLRRGVLYVGIDPCAMASLFKEIAFPKKTVKPVRAVAGIGPSLFFGREEAPFIPWDPESTDENSRCLVREREWPYCWGDVVWAVSVWEAQPTYFRWSMGDFGQVFLGTAFAPTEDHEGLKEWVDKIAEAEGAKWRIDLPREFWEMGRPEP